HVRSRFRLHHFIYNSPDALLRALDQSAHRTRRIEGEDHFERLPLIRVLIVHDVFRLIVTHDLIRVLAVHVRPRTSDAEHDQQDRAKQQSITEKCLPKYRLHKRNLRWKMPSTRWNVACALCRWDRACFERRWKTTLRRFENGRANYLGAQASLPACFSQSVIA